MDKAIQRVVSNRNGNHQGQKGLTPQDHFYREISKIDEIILGLQSVQDDSIISDSPRDLVSNVRAVNTLITVSEKKKTFFFSKVTMNLGFCSHYSPRRHQQENEELRRVRPG